MPFKIAIASGKGGTGKTTLSVNLFHYLERQGTNPVHLLDCDVEEPNDLLFFPGIKSLSQKEVTRDIPLIDTDACTFCRKCVEYCEYNAIVVIPPAGFAEVNASLCHSCGACTVACQDGAISEVKEVIGQIRHCQTQAGGRVSEGRLRIGSAMQTMMIKELKRSVNEYEMTCGDHEGIIICDAPPGTGCPVVESLSDADYTILVTEPTPFGLYDLKLSAELLKDMHKPFGVVINKAGLGTKDVHAFLSAEGIEILGEVPFNKTYASMYATGQIFDSVPANIEKSYSDMIRALLPKIIKYEGDYHLKR